MAFIHQAIDILPIPNSLLAAPVLALNFLVFVGGAWMNRWAILHSDVAMIGGWLTMAVASFFVAAGLLSLALA
jgi:hypothetical protein